VSEKKSTFTLSIWIAEVKNVWNITSWSPACCHGVTLRCKALPLLLWMKCNNTVSFWVLQSCSKLTQYVRFYVLTAVSMKVTSALCSLIELHWCFRGAYYLHHQGDEWWWRQYTPWNVSLLQQDYSAMYPRKLSPSYAVWIDIAWWKCVQVLCLICAFKKHN
jgi:hypothetical protein